MEFPGYPWLICLAALGGVLQTMPTNADPTAPAPGQFLGARQTAYPDWFKDSFLEFADDVEEAAAEGKRLIIFFHQDGCPYCNALVERNLSQKDIEEKIRANFDVVALNLRGDRELVSVGGDAYTEKAFAEALNIQFTPTLLFFDESGKVILRLNGYVPPREFGIALDYVSQKKERHVDYRDYLSDHLSSDSGSSLTSRSFFAPPPYDLKAARERGKPLAVFFEQRQCPNCDRLHADTISDPETSVIIGSFHAVQLDMWADDVLVTPTGSRTSAREWARELEVKYAPTIVLFSSDGVEVIRSEAYFKRFHTQSILDYVASGDYRREPDFQRYLTRRADSIRASGKDVDIWE
jgi:thioredoxin-related protein